MATYKVLRYIGIETIVEADNADHAIEVEEKLNITGDLDCKDAKGFSWWISDAMGCEVRDENDISIIEQW